MTAEQKAECEKAQKAWNESGESKNYTDPCDYCIYSCNCIPGGCLTK